MVGGWSLSSGGMLGAIPALTLSVLLGTRHLGRCPVHMMSHGAVSCPFQATHMMNSLLWCLVLCKHFLGFPRKLANVGPVCVPSPPPPYAWLCHWALSPPEPTPASESSPRCSGSCLSSGEAGRLDRMQLLPLPWLSP